MPMPFPHRLAKPDTARFWLLLFVLLVLAPGIGLRDPAPPDEPRFVLAAQSMVASGDWLLPRRGSELYAHKPPLFLWMQAAAHGLVRDWRVAFLLPSLLAALATLWLVHDLGRHLWGPRAGVHAALALLVTLQFGLQARRGQIDMVLVAFTTLSLWALLRHLLLQRDRRLALLAGLAAGLGTITKGVGFLPLLALLPWGLLPRQRRGAGPLQGGTIALGFVAGCLVWLGPLLWMAMTRADPALHGYLEDILLRQTAGRYADPWHHLRPPWYYLQVLATLWLPGVLLLPWLLPAWTRRWRRGDPRIIVLLGWAVLVLLFFSASPGKREVYVLPVLPAACLAAAPLLSALLRRGGPRWLLAGYATAVALALLGLGAALWFDLAGVATRVGVQRSLDEGTLRAVALSLLATGAAALGMAGIAWRRPAAGVLAFTAVLWCGYGLAVAPALDPSSSGRALMQDVARSLPPAAELGLVAWTEQLLLQAPPGTREFGFERSASEQWRAASAWQAGMPSGRWVLVEASALHPCIDRQHAIPVGRANRRNYLLVPGTAWIARCGDG